MIIELKRETCTEVISSALPPSLKRELLEYCSKHGVKESAAIRHMISVFLSSDFSKTEVPVELSKSRPKSKKKVVQS